MQNMTTGVNDARSGVGSVTLSTAPVIGTVIRR